MKTIRMTDRWLNSVKAKEGRDEYADAIVAGLRLRVSSRSKKWSVVTRIDKKLKRIPIGDAQKIGLKDARDKANDILEDPEAALEPTPEKDDSDAEKAAAGIPNSPSLKSMCAAYVTRMKKKNQPSHKEYNRALITSDHSFTNFMKKQLGRPATAAEIEPQHVSDWLSEIHERAPSHARHCRAYLHAVFEWALKAEFDYTVGEDKRSYGVTTNPAAATPSGDTSNARDRVLSIDELKNFWFLLPKGAEPLTVVCIRLIIAMGGTRITEISRSEKPWYDHERLKLPKTKNSREHILPLTEHAKEQLIIAKALAVPDSRFLFPHERDNNRSLLVTSIGKVARRLIEDHKLEPFQMRDLRRTFKTHLLDREYVDEREIDIWHNHGQKADVARKHYTWAEYINLKQRVAGQIDRFLSEVGV